MINSMRRCRYCGVFVEMDVMENLFDRPGYQPVCTRFKCLWSHIKMFLLVKLRG